MKFAIGISLLTFIIFSSIGKCAAADEGNPPDDLSRSENNHQNLTRPYSENDLLALRDQQNRNLGINSGQTQHQQNQSNQQDLATPENYNHRTLPRTHRTMNLHALAFQQLQARLLREHLERQQQQQNQPKRRRQ